MAQLVLSFLGGFQATLDGAPVTTFESDKVRALLAYLAVEYDRPQRREHLAGLLWPDMPERDARTNLRHVLANLRKVLADRDVAQPFLLTSRQTLQFNVESDHVLDVRTFSTALSATAAHPHASLEGCAPCVARLREAAELYTGDFLAGFSLDSDLFEDWATLWRERLHIQALDALDTLAAYHEQRGDHTDVIRYAQRQVELEPWRESAHRQWMRALACSGQRGMALAQYEACRRILKAELDTEPETTTTHLFEQIRNEQPSLLMSTASVALTPRSPTFLDTDVVIEAPTFVAREHELARMDAALQAILTGQGHVSFIAGEAGQGKTALMQAFTARALAAIPDLIIADGHCNAYSGIGDPYLPFREILALLTGDVEAQYAAGVLTQDHARRLWNTLPLTARALLADGTDLIGTFVPGLPLLQRAAACAAEVEAEWLGPLRTYVETQKPGASTPRQDDLFEQITTVLHSVARQVPLVLIIDDMQWADMGSISLLFHLGRRLAGNRILILGAYRPEEVTHGRDGERHPLAPLINEFQREWGDIIVNVGQTEPAHFVQALLDSETHALSVDFCNRLTQQTEGHPLFTLELLHGMQERGDLVRDTEGQWIEGAALDWEILPARVEAAIAERIHRLPAPLQELLRVASVEGEVFTAEAIAQAQRTDPRDLVAHLSGTLRRHHLVRAEGIQTVDGQRLSRYRFRHILFQRYLYSTLDHVEHAHLHAQVGTALEALHGDQATEIAPQLALHFELAGMLSEATDYYRQAGERAIQMAANAEAAAHLNKGLDLLNTLPPSHERDERELALQLMLTVPLTTLKSWSAPEVVRACDRAMELSQTIDNTQQLLQSILVRQFAHSTLAEHRTALGLAEQRYNLIQRLAVPTLMAEAHAGLTITNMFVGQFTRSVQHLAQVMPLYDIEAYRDIVALGGMDPGVAALSVGLYSLWYLGYPDQALEASRQALAIAQDLNNPYATQFLFGFKGRFHRWRHEVEDDRQVAEAEMKIGLDHGIDLAKANGMLELAWVRSEEGYPDEAISMFEDGLALWHAIGMHNHHTEWLSVLAEMHAKAGRPERGLELIEDAFTFMRSSEERYHEAELYRLCGLLRMQQDAGKVEAAEEDFRRAIDAAQQLEARMCELRATTCLARLWQQQGKCEQAHQALAEIYGWFTEGFDTLDLKEAKSLLDELTVK